MSGFQKRERKVIELKFFSFRYLGMIILLSLVGFLTVYPLGMIVFGSFRSAAPGLPGHFTLQGYIQGFSDPTIIKALYNTFSLGIVRTILTSILAIFFCWILIRTDTPFKGILEILMWINFFIPIMPMAMGWILLLDPSYGLIQPMADEVAVSSRPRIQYLLLLGDCMGSHGLFHLREGIDVCSRFS